MLPPALKTPESEDAQTEELHFDSLDADLGLSTDDADPATARRSRSGFSPQRP